MYLQYQSRADSEKFLTSRYNLDQNSLTDWLTDSGTVPGIHDILDTSVIETLGFCSYFHPPSSWGLLMSLPSVE